jgi:heme-degrading monooxygenase HmoA
MSDSTTTIASGAALVTLINVLTVKREDQDRLVQLLIQATEHTMKNVPGFISANIHKSLGGERVTNYAQWASKEAFEAMLKNPQAREHMAPIQKIATYDAHLYQVVSVQHE